MLNDMNQRKIMAPNFIKPYKICLDVGNPVNWPIRFQQYKYKDPRWHGFPWIARPRDAAKNMPNLPGIYAVVEDDNLYYVGQSANLQQRWWCHEKGERAEKELSKPLVYWQPWSGFSDEQNRLYYEAILILAYEPAWNSTFVLPYDAKKDFAEYKKRMTGKSPSEKLVNLVEAFGLYGYAERSIHAPHRRMHHSAHLN